MDIRDIIMCNRGHKHLRNLNCTTVYIKGQRLSEKSSTNHDDDVNAIM